MNTPILNSPTMSETLKARKAHIYALLKIIDANSEKITKTKELTTKAIKAEIEYIDEKIKHH